MDMLPLQAFIGPCWLAEHKGNMTGEEAAYILKQAEAAGAARRILISGQSVITPQAARVFAQGGISLIGVESQSVGPVNAPMEVHKTLLSGDIVLLEGLVLKNIPRGKYHLSALPLNIQGAEGAPCRAYLSGDHL